MQLIYAHAVRIVGGMMRRVRLIHYRLLGVSFDGNAWIQKIEIPKNFRAIRIGCAAALDHGVVLLAVTERSKPVIEIGDSTYINRATIIDAVERVSVGRKVAIGPGCYITDHDHGFDLGAPVLSQELVCAPTVIEDNVWLGAHVVVLKGVTIGRNSVVGAGSVVSRSIPPESIAVGSPARVIRNIGAICA